MPKLGREDTNGPDIIQVQALHVGQEKAD